MPEKTETLALVGWMDEDSALKFFRAGGAHSEGAARRQWVAYRERTDAAAAARNYTPPPCQIVENDAAARFLAACAGRISAVLAVDPAQLLAFQFCLSTERAAEHAGAAATWAERCLVTERPRVPLPVTSEGNSMYFDLPHAEHILMLTPQGELRVEQKPAYPMVADIGGGRLLLRGGYHRAYAYLSAKPRPKEPFLAALTTHGMVELEIPGMREKLTSSSPPLVGDFLDPGLTMTLRTAKPRFRLKITAEMSQVPDE